MAKLSQKDEFIAKISGMDSYEVRNLEKQINRGKESRIVFNYIRFSIIILLLIILGSMVGCPKYRVYQQTMEGKAEFEKAKQNRQIKVEEAKAKNEAAISEAEAKVKMANAENEAIVIKAEGQREADSIRAIGVARANEIIGESLEGNKDYLQFLWIDQLSKGNQKVYIPTEANLPILEARKQ